MRPPARTRSGANRSRHPGRLRAEANPRSLPPSLSNQLVNRNPSRRLLPPARQAPPVPRVPPAPRGRGRPEGRRANELKPSTPGRAA